MNTATWITKNEAVFAYFSRHLWLGVWIVSLISLFEVEIRSVGHSEQLDQINLLPGFWLSDLGLMLPILFAVLAGGLFFFKMRLFRYFLLTCGYGMILFFARNNSFDGLGIDLRTCLAILTGFSLVKILPHDVKKNVTVMNIFLLMAIAMTFYHLLVLPEFDLSQGERVSTDTAHILVTVPLILVSPLLIFSGLTKNAGNTLTAWLNLLLLMFLLIVIMKTRSSFFALSAAFALAMAVFFYLSKRAFSFRTIAKSAAIVSLFALVFTAVYFYQESNIDEFILRIMASGEDYTSLWRKLEVLQVFETLTPTDLVVGMGFNPPSPLFTMKEGGWAVEGENYNSLHIGILNVWWRFGLIVFALWVGAIIKLVFRWVNSLITAKYRNNRAQPVNRTLGLIACAPGVFVLLSLSLLSGGWSVHSFLALGILSGLYLKMEKYPLACRKEEDGIAKA